MIGATGVTGGPGEPVKAGEAGTISASIADFWPGSGFAQLQRAADGTLRPGDAYLRLFLARPELAPVDESCAAERRLHAALLEQPDRPVEPAQLARLADADARENYSVFLRFRDALLAAGSLQSFYVGLFRAGAAGTPISIAPLFIDLVTQALVRGLLAGPDGAAEAAFEARAGELLFRAQRITRNEGRTLAGDRDALDLLRQDGGLGEIGRLLIQAQAPLRAVDVAVLDTGNADRYWAAAAAGRHTLLLDLSHELRQDVGHGLQFRLHNARSGLPALARVLERWTAHLLGVQVRIQPVARIDDAAWRWHVGLDAEASALLNDLYAERPVSDERRERLISLFRLDFADPAEMRADVAGRPVYLGLAHGADGVLRLKPQNLLLNLPLAIVS